MFHVKQFDVFSKNTLQKFKIYQQILEKWQSKINLISRLTVKDAFQRHFMDSAQLYPLIPPQTKTLLDLGSGAGFPALVLAILNQTQNPIWPAIPVKKAEQGDNPLPYDNVSLGDKITSQEIKPFWSIVAVESDQRKCCFMDEVARQCQIRIILENQRIERVKHAPFDVITARALADLTTLLDYSLPFVHSQTHLLFLKGQGAEAEIQEALKKYDFSYCLYQSQTDEKGQIIEIEQLIKRDKK
ncbi:MAG: 16S rRNA (guanine(527)-N(7))-methyltransferase RsmG [Alphaproteobacteria bacterium]|nr:16S rRNA (guanine(527)-N(7))-methyltransferase RsmG [Alphaproteobacteria bacterium]